VPLALGHDLDVAQAGDGLVKGNRDEGRRIPADLAEAAGREADLQLVAADLAHAPAQHPLHQPAGDEVHRVVAQRDLDVIGVTANLPPVISAGIPGFSDRAFLRRRDDDQQAAAVGVQGAGQRPDEQRELVAVDRVDAPVIDGHPGNSRALVATLGAVGQFLNVGGQQILAAEDDLHRAGIQRVGVVVVADGQKDPVAGPGLEVGGQAAL